MSETKKRKVLSPLEKEAIDKEKKELAEKKCDIEKAKNDLAQKKAIFTTDITSFKKKWNLKNSPQLGKCLK